MAFPTLRSSVSTISCGALLYLAACDQWHLSVNGDGLVFIAVIGDRDQPRERFRVRTRQSAGTVRVLTVPASGRLTLSPTASGVLELMLLAPEGCRVSGSNPRTLMVSAGETVTVNFDVQCGP